MEKTTYKNLLYAAPFGYSYNQMVYDLAGNPIDYILLEMNDSFRKFTGLDDSFIGKRRTEVLKETPESLNFWLSHYSKVAQEGGFETVEHLTESFNRFVRVFIFSNEKDHFAMLITDISKERKDLDEKLAMLNALGEFVYELDENFVLTNIYTRDEKSLIRPRNELIGKSMDAFISQPQASLFYEAMKRAKNLGVMQSFTFISPYSNNTSWYKAEIYYVDINGTKRFISRISDVTDQVLSLAALKESEEKYRLITENASDVIWVFNATLMKFTYCSPSVINLRGYTPQEAIDMSLEQSMTPESLAIVNEAMKRIIPKIIANHKFVDDTHYELQQPCKDGSIVWVEITTQFRFNSKNEIEVVGVSRNIEKRKQAEKDIRFFSTHDQLTGLFDRRYFQEQKAIFEHSKDILPLSIALADIDGLKLTNDVFGHQAGDDLLVSFVESMKEISRKNDIIFRTGGDEFLMLMPRTTESEAKNIISQIKINISKKKMSTFSLSASFGLVVKTSQNENMDLLLRQAEDLMYHEKIVESSDFKIKVVKSVTSRLHQKNKFEQLHSENVMNTCQKIGEAMHLSKQEMNDLSIAAFVHDIGKLGFSKELLSKKTNLTPSEISSLTRHPEIGYQILRSVDAFSNIATIVLAHHERVDGKGYPKGLKGKEIPLLSKILAVANIYDAISTPGRSNEPYDSAQIITIMKREAGTRLDKAIVKVFVEKVLGKKWSKRKVSAPI